MGRCAVCGVELVGDLVVMHSEGRPRRRCRPCRNEAERRRRAAAPRKPRKPDPPGCPRKRRWAADERKRRRAIRDAQRARQAAEADGTADYFGQVEQLDHEVRCYWRFFTANPCTNKVVSGSPGLWGCRQHPVD